MNKDQEKKKKKKQKEAKKKLAGLLRKLKKAHEKYEEVQEIIDQIKSVLEEYKDYLPQNVKEALQKATRLSVRTPEGIKTTLDTLNSALELAESTLPGAIGPAAAVAGISIAAVAGIAVSAYFMIMVDIDIINDGCPTMPSVMGIPSIPTDGKITIQVPNTELYIDGTAPGTVSFRSQIVSPTLSIPSEITSIQFDGMSVIGNSLNVDLAASETHTLIISCRPSGAGMPR